MNLEVNKAGFVYTVEVVGRDGLVKSVEHIKNIMPTEALSYLLKSSLLGDTQYTSWYLGLFNNDYTPVAGDTMSTFITSAGENVDYDGTERQSITFPSVSGASLTTSADPNVFDFSVEKTIRGAFISTSPTWDGSTGMLLSAVKFTNPKYIESGESLRVPVGFALISA